MSTQANGPSVGSDVSLGPAHIHVDHRGTPGPFDSFLHQMRENFRADLAATESRIGIEFHGKSRDLEARIHESSADVMRSMAANSEAFAAMAKGFAELVIENSRLRGQLKEERDLLHGRLAENHGATLKAIRESHNVSADAINGIAKDFVNALKAIETVVNRPVPPLETYPAGKLWRAWWKSLWSK